MRKMITLAVLLLMVTAFAVVAYTKFHRPVVVPDTNLNQRLAENAMGKEIVLPPPEYAADLGDLAVVAEFWPKLPAPREGDWLSVNSEPKQTTAELLAAAPSMAKKKAAGIELLPILPLDPKVAPKMIGELFNVIGTTFQCPVRVSKELETPKEYYFRDGKQINAETLLDFLVDRRPKDVWAVAGVTSFDLASPDLNFVFGMSSLEDGVCITSSHRFGDTDQNKFLMRVYSTVVHELGHSLGLQHCIAYNCLGNGCNSLEESDSRPKMYCPHCLAKLRALRGIDPIVYYREMGEMFRRYKQDKDAELAMRAYNALIAAQQKTGK